jgi:hypothetical protein
LGLLLIFLFAAWSAQVLACDHKATRDQDDGS